MLVLSAPLRGAAGLLLVSRQARASIRSEKITVALVAAFFITAFFDAAAAGPDACVILGNLATCSGNQSAGIASGSDFLAPPVSQLEVNNLTANIAPASGTRGVDFTSTADVTINRNSGSFSIIATGSDIHGLSARSTGGLVSVTNIGDISVTGHNAIGIFASANPASAAGVTVTTTGNIIASGDGADAIFAQSVGGNSSVNILSGTVSGGTGTGYGVAFKNGLVHTVTNYGVITSQSGTAIQSGAGFDHTISNYGTITGDVVVYGYAGGETLGANAFNNNIGGIFNAGSTVTLGAGNTLTNSGNFLPGGVGVIRTTALDGNLVQTNAGRLTIDLSNSTNDRINVTGTATLAGAVKAVGTGGSYTVGQQYTVLNATGGLTGIFGSVSGTAIGFTQPRLSYDAQNVYLVLEQGRLVPLLPPSSSTNANAVAHGIDTAVANGASPPSGFDVLLGLTGSNLINALSQLSSEVGAFGSTQASVQMTNSFLSLLLNPFGGLPSGNPGTARFGLGFAAEKTLSSEAAQAYAAVTPKDRRLRSSIFAPNWSIWGAAYGGTNKIGGDSATGSHDTTARSYGFATGMDYRVSPDTLVGFALAGGGTNYGLSDGLGGGRSDAFQMGVYGSKQFGAAYVSAALSYAAHWMTTDRTVTVSGTDRLRTDFNAHSIGGRLESGYRFDIKPVGITPYAALQAQNFRTPTYTEIAVSGSNDFALSYNSKSTTVVRTELGAWFDKTVAAYGGALLTLRTRAAWTHDHSNNEGVSAAFQTLPGSNFIVNGAAVVPNSALLSAGAEMRLPSGMLFGAKFDGEFASRSQAYAGTGTVRYVW